MLFIGPVSLFFSCDQNRNKVTSERRLVDWWIGQSVGRSVGGWVGGCTTYYPSTNKKNNQTNLPTPPHSKLHSTAETIMASTLTRSRQPATLPPTRTKVLRPPPLHTPPTLNALLASCATAKALVLAHLRVFIPSVLSRSMTSMCDPGELHTGLFQQC